MKAAVWVSLVAALLSGCNRAPELKAIQAAADALAGGAGRDRILAIRTLVIEGEGVNSNLGQNLTPDAPPTLWKITDYQRAIDLAANPAKPRMRVEQVRTAQFPFALTTVARQKLAIDGDVAWNVSEEGTAARLTEQGAKDRRVELLHYPITVVRAALDPAARLSNLRTNGNLQLLDLVTAAGDMLTLALDTGTKLPASVTSITDQPNLGDVATETSFLDYQNADGVLLPKHLVTKIDKWLQSDIRVSKNTVNANAGDLAAPAVVSGSLPAPANPPQEVTAVPAGKGIWWLAGSGNHRSIVFEFSDHLTLFELPASEARAQAVIAKARSLSFGKRLTEVIVSHHHFDHSAGLRTAVSEGLTIITDRGNVEFFKNLVARKHTIVPDQLAQIFTAQPMKIVPVDDEMVLKDDAMELHLFHVKNNSHAETLLMGWVPGEHILVQADLYDSGWQRYPWAENLRENVAFRKLNVEKDVPVHGVIESYADVLKTMQSKK
jgi:hypothetical protein